MAEDRELIARLEAPPPFDPVDMAQALRDWALALNHPGAALMKDLTQAAFLIEFIMQERAEAAARIVSLCEARDAWARCAATFGAVALRSRAEKAERERDEYREKWQISAGNVARVAKRANEYRSIVQDLAKVERPADADDRPCDDTWEDANTLWDLADRARTLVEISNA